jgi:1,2-diacylglycerol 3-alpha-glucosyltransferase
MRIGFFTDGYLPQINGVATTVEELRESLVQRQHKVYVVAPKYPHYKDQEKNVLRLRSVRLYKNPELRIPYMFPERILQKVLKMDFDIIHGFSGGSTPSLGIALAKIKKKPYVFTYNTRLNQYTHYVLNGKLIRPKTVERVARMYCNACDQIIAPTKYIKDELISFGVKKPIAVIPNGVNTIKFKPVKSNYLKELTGLKESDKIALCVARLAKEKSLDFLIKAFTKFSKINPNVYFVIAGDGPERVNLEKLIAKLNIGSKVILLGMVPYNNIPKIYNGADVFIFASTTETQGMIVPEAMSSGLPVLAVRDRVFEQFIDSGKNGILVEKNIDIFNQSLQKLLDDDKLRLNMGKKAREKIEKYSLEEIAKKFENLYKELL